MSRILFVGMSNVGKSSLINSIVGRKVFLCGNITNLTNDINEVIYNSFTLIDSPGISSLGEIDVILSKVSFDFLVFVSDVFSDMSLEKKFISKFPESFLIINKIDLDSFFNAKIKHKNLIETSSIRSKNNNILKKIIHKDSMNNILHKKNISNTGFNVSIFGRSNVGKSTLINKLLGYERFKAIDQIGTTRDVSQVCIGDLAVYDTPGYRKCKLDGYTFDIQKQVANHLKSSLNDVGVLVIDAVDGFTSVDKYLAQEILKKYFIVVCINKIDLVSKQVLDDIKNQIIFMLGEVEVVCVSAKNGVNVDRVIKFARFKRRYRDFNIKTSLLNKWIQEVPHLNIKYLTYTGSFGFKVFSKRDFTSGDVRFLNRFFCQKTGFKGMRFNFDFQK